MTEYRLNDFDGDELRTIARYIMEDIATGTRERQEAEGKLARMKETLVAMTIDSADEWIMCHGVRRGDPFFYSEDIADRLVFIFSLAQAIRDKEKELVARPRWRFLNARRRAIERHLGEHRADLDPARKGESRGR